MRESWSSEEFLSSHLSFILHSCFNLLIQMLISIYLCTYIKGVTMRAIFSNPAGWKFIDSNGWKKMKFLRKIFFRQNCFGASTFSAFSKGQKSTSKFQKTPETKKMRSKTFKCSNFLLFFKKIQVNMVKNVKKCYKYAIST